MGHKSLRSKGLKRVDGEIYLAAPPQISNRPPTRSVPLRRCNNGICLNSPRQTAHEFDNDARRENWDNAGHHLPSRRLPQRGASPNGTDESNQSFITVLTGRSAGNSTSSWNPSRSSHEAPHEQSSHQNPTSSTTRRSGILSSIYETLQPPRVHREETYNQGVDSADVSLSNFCSETTTLPTHEDLTTAATIATDDIFLRTATALDQNDTRWGHEFTESEVQVPKPIKTPASMPKGATIILQKKASTIPTLGSGVTSDLISAISIPERNSSIVEEPPTANSSVGGTGADRNNNDPSLTVLKSAANPIESRTSTSNSIRLNLPFEGGDSPSPSTPSDWTARKPRATRSENTSCTPTPIAPPASAATSSSDKPPFTLCFRRMTPRPRSIITSRMEGSTNSFQLNNTTSMPNSIVQSQSRGPTPITPGSVSVHNNDNNNRTHPPPEVPEDINANVQLEHDENNNNNNNERSDDINNNNNTNSLAIPEKPESGKEHEGKSKEALRMVTALDENAVGGKTVEAYAEVDLDAVDQPKDMKEKMEVEEEFWESTDEDEKNDEEKTGEYGENTKTKEGEEDESGPYGSSQGYNSRSTPFLKTEKGAIRFHLPGRIQHKTTIKVSHFPTGEDKNVTVNLQPDPCLDYVEDGSSLGYNNQNFMAPPPVPPLPYPYGGYPYYNPSYYYGGYRYW